MSKRKDRERAEVGFPHVTEKTHKVIRSYVCANCHKPLTSQYVKVGEFLFHVYCPKRVKPFSAAELRAVGEGK